MLIRLDKVIVTKETINGSNFTGPDKHFDNNESIVIIEATILEKNLTQTKNVVEREKIIKDVCKPIYSKEYKLVCVCIRGTSHNLI